MNDFKIGDTAWHLAFYNRLNKPGEECLSFFLDKGTVTYVSKHYIEIEDSDKQTISTADGYSFKTLDEALSFMMSKLDSLKLDEHCEHSGIKLTK